MNVPRTLTDGRLSITRKLGEGGMAIVHAAYDHDLKVWRAVKFLRPEMAKRKSLRRRFLGEAQALARLNHKNVVRVYDVGESEGWPWMVMSLSRGGSLESYLEKYQVMDPHLAVRAMIQVCAGVQAAHDSGILHRDIKPDNVLITTKNVCQVTDFGIAQVHDQMRATRTGSIMGTLGYMAPEQQKDAKYLAAEADVFSLGATLFALVSGVQPTDLYMAAQHDDLLDRVIPVLHPFVLRSTQFQPADRYPSVEAFGHDLQRVLTELAPSDDAPPLAHDVRPVDDVPERQARTAPPAPPRPPEPTGEEPTPVSVPYLMPRMDQASMRPSYLEGEAEARQKRKLEALERIGTIKRQKTARPAPVAGVPTAATKPKTVDAHDGQESVADALRTLALPISLVLIALVGFTLLSVGVLSYGSEQVSSAGFEAAESREALYAAIRSEGRVAADLQAIGADTTPLTGILVKFEEAQEPTKEQLASAYITAAARLLDQHGWNASPQAAPRAQSAVRSLGTLHDADQDNTDARERWEQAGGSGLGYVACSLGVVLCPELD